MNKKNRLVTRPPPLWPSCFPCTSWNVLLEPSCHIPSAQNIESIDSKKFNPGMELFAAWKWLVCYLQERELPIDAKEWKLFHSHQTVIYQGDNHNCGPFSILNTICIPHQYHPNKVNVKNCKLLRRRLLHFFVHLGERSRLCKQWGTKYPLTVDTVDLSTVSVTKEGGGKSIGGGKDSVPVTQELSQ